MTNRMRSCNGHESRHVRCQQRIFALFEHVAHSCMYLQQMIYMCSVIFDELINFSSCQCWQSQDHFLQFSKIGLLEHVLFSTTQFLYYNRSGRSR